MVSPSLGPMAPYMTTQKMFNHLASGVGIKAQPIGLCGLYDYIFRS